MKKIEREKKDREAEAEINLRMRQWASHIRKGEVGKVEWYHRSRNVHDWVINRGVSLNGLRFDSKSSFVVGS